MTKEIFKVVIAELYLTKSYLCKIYTKIFTNKSICYLGFASNYMGQGKGQDMGKTRLAPIEDAW